jgi:4-oxalocrotonate tautomerase
MPLVHIYVTPPLGDEGQRKELFRSVTEAISRSLAKPPEQTRILLHELPETDWAVAGETVDVRRRASKEQK